MWVEKVIIIRNGGLNGGWTLSILDMMEPHISSIRRYNYGSDIIKLKEFIQNYYPYTSNMYTHDLTFRQNKLYKNQQPGDIPGLLHHVSPHCLTTIVHEDNYPVKLHFIINVFLIISMH